MVHCKNGNYFANRGACLVLPIFIFICNFKLMSYFEKLLTPSGSELLTAKNIMSCLSRILYQVVVFTGMYIVLFKTTRIALILNKMAKLYNNIHVCFPSCNFTLAVTANEVCICSNVIFFYYLLRTDILAVFFYVVVEVFVLSFTYLAMFTVFLTFSLIKSMNIIVAKFQTNCQVSRNCILSLRESRERLADLYEDIQNTLGFLLTVTTINRCTYFVQDVNEVVVCVIDLLYKPQTEQGYDVSYFIILHCLWTLLDISLVISTVILCSLVEIEVRVNYMCDIYTDKFKHFNITFQAKKMGPLLIKLANRMDHSNARDSVSFLLAFNMLL
jgi:hypothetical protein